MDVLVMYEFVSCVTRGCLILCASDKRYNIFEMKQLLAILLLLLLMLQQAAGV